MKNRASHLKVPRKAVRFILFQRTQYLLFRRSKILQKLKATLPRRIGFALETLLTRFNFSVSLEALFSRKKVAELFNEEIWREYEEMKKFLPEKAEAILDIGCGIAGIDVFLNNHYHPEKPSIHLIDKTEIPKKVYYSLRPRACFYNSLPLARQFLLENGVSSEQISTEEANDKNQIGTDRKFDIVLSCIAWGFHFPVETYLDEVYDRLKPGGVLILDVRKGFGGIEKIKERFGNIAIIRDYEKHSRIATRKIS